jgi:hypothetical protein
MKMDDLDIEGTKKLLNEIYTTFVRFGAITYILLNRISGYCVPITLIDSPEVKTNPAHTYFKQIDSNNKLEMQNPQNVLEGLEEVTGIKYLTPLPCYCDIQFSSREFLTVVNNPNHPFSKKLQHIINEIIKD